MTWIEALEIVVGRTRHERYRELCADDWPDHDAHRALMVSLATGEDPIPAPTPEDRALLTKHPCCP